jgi:hypothetical protein
MHIEIKINGEAAELQDVLRALLNKAEQATTTEANSIDLRKPTKSRKPGDVVKVETSKADEHADGEKYLTGSASYPSGMDKPATEAVKEQPEAPTTEVQGISFEEFRKAVGAAALINKEAVRAALQKYGAAKTSEVKSEEYGAIMDDLKAIK